MNKQIRPKRHKRARATSCAFLLPALLFLLPTWIFAQATSPSLVLEKVLKETGLDRDRLQPDPHALLSSAGSSNRPPLLRAVQSDPLSAPYRIGMAEQRFLQRTDSPHRLFLHTAGLTNANIARGYLGNPLGAEDNELLQAEDPLLRALEMLEEESGSIANKDVPSWDDLPNPARFEIARLVAALSSAEKFHNRAFRELPDNLDVAMMIEQIMAGRYRDFDAPDYRLYVEDVEYEALFAAMLDIMAALEDFDHYVENASSLPEVAWELETPIGTIAIHTGGEDNPPQHPRPPPIVDLGGDDTYFEGTQNDPTRASGIYHRAGNDRYSGGMGHGSAALFGSGVTWDVAGDDLYDGASFSQGSAVFGAAVHLDEAGNDSYRGTAYSQAYALGGAAILADLGGNDEFHSVISSQASAGPFAAAVLLNSGGDDVYTLANDPLIDRSAQSPGHNVSMGQGAGTGIRADLRDGRSVSGGTGLLIDDEGDDVYTAQVFCQGTGFLAGCGFLIDSAGNDRYSGVWYAQGSAAHSAAAGLIDRAGNDTYTASKYTSIAVAHDYSTAFLVDEQGDDRYRVGNLGLGAGNENGVAFLADAGGNDSYEIKSSEGYGLGAARIENWGTSRENALGLGLFFDLGGGDLYETQRSGPGNDTLWTWPRLHPDWNLPAENGVGIDGVYTNPFRTLPRTEPTGKDRQRLEEARSARRAYRSKIPAGPGGIQSPPDG